MSPNATPAAQMLRPCHQVPRLPRKEQVDVAKCHASPRKVPWRHGRPTATNAPPEPAKCHSHSCHAYATTMSPSATPARKVPRRHWRATATKRATASPVS